MARKTTEIVSLSLRIREEHRRLLAQEAKRHGRSLNAEIVSRLNESFQRQNLSALMREHIDLAVHNTVQKLEEILKGKEGDSK